MPTYNLLTERWIPVVDLKGSDSELGLLEVLERAHELREVVDSAPPIQFGLYRLLVAFVMDAFAIGEIHALEDQLAQERFDRAVLERYVEAVGPDRFDLFHPQYPFLQTAPLEGDDDKRKSVAELFFHLPTGSFATHFFHRRADEHALSPAVCARGLTALAPFTTAGGAGYSPSINGAPPWYVLVQGKSLRETLLLNCLVLNDAGLVVPGTPSWRTDGQITPKQGTACESLLEGLTWRPRHVRLLPGDPGTCTYSGRPSMALVRRMVFGPGLKFGSSPWLDPNAAYMLSDNGLNPLRPREDREPWRDTGPLLLLRRGEHRSEKGQVQFARPPVVEQFHLLRDRGTIDRRRPVRVEIYGMRTDKMKVFEWDLNRLALPPGVSDNPYAGQLVQEALNLADSVAYALRSAVKRAYPRDGEGNEKSFDRLVQMTQAAYWSDLRCTFQQRFVHELAAQDPADAEAPGRLMTTWKAELRKVGWKRLDDALRALDSNAEALRRRVAALQGFAAALTARLDPDPARKERRKKA
ncbi:MAG: type I-E CRISPR-associated protein Cse1/CasA [Bacillota bacterium]